MNPSAHPHELPVEEIAAVITVNDMVRAAAYPPTLVVPEPLYRLVFSAFGHWPEWNVDGEPIVINCRFVRTSETREHILFKNTALIEERTT